MAGESSNANFEKRLYDEIHALSSRQQETDAAIGMLLTKNTKVKP